MLHAIELFIKKDKNLQAHSKVGFRDSKSLDMQYACAAVKSYNHDILSY